MSTRYTNKGRRLQRELESLEANVERRIVSNEITNNEFYLLTRRLESIKKSLREIRRDYEANVNRATRNITPENRSAAISSIINGVKKTKIGNMDESLARLIQGENVSLNNVSLNNVVRQASRLTTQAGTLWRTEFLGA
jgi:hypothetical protein